MVPHILVSFSPPYFPLFSDEETSVLSSWLICSLQQSVLLPFSQSIFSQTVFLPGILFFCVSLDSLNFFLPSRTSSAPAFSAKPFTRMQPHQSFLNLVSKPFLWLLKQYIASHYCLCVCVCVCVCLLNIFFSPGDFSSVRKGRSLKDRRQTRDLYRSR